MVKSKKCHFGWLADAVTSQTANWPMGRQSAEMAFFGLDYKIRSDFFVKMNYFHFLSICFWWPEKIDALTSQTANRPPIGRNSIFWTWSKNNKWFFCKNELLLYYDHLFLMAGKDRCSNSPNGQLAVKRPKMHFFEKKPFLLNYKFYFRWF